MSNPPSRVDMVCKCCIPRALGQEAGQHSRLSYRVTNGATLSEIRIVFLTTERHHSA